MRITEILSGRFRHALVFILIINCGLASNAQKADQDALVKAAQSRKWHLLLHFHRSTLGRAVSEISPSDFFIDKKNGPTSPLAELQATVSAFEKNPAVSCQYPARRRFLIEELGFKIPALNCPRYKDWRVIFVPNSLSLVFATAFFGNAASAFGHTFMRIDGALSTPNGPKNALLDYGLNFAAQASPNDGAFAYAYKGLTGGYRGVYSILPYIEKVQEYRDREHRDLWEYRLNLTPNQIDRLLEHLWELETSQISYYFLNKNCSYNLLGLLEVANPDWHLTDSFNYWTLPTDTIRAVASISGAVTEVKYRPSLHRQLREHFKAMSSHERETFFKLRTGPLDLTGNESSVLLDALIDEQKFRYGTSSEQYPEAEKNRLNKLLLARAKTKGAMLQTKPQDVPRLRVDQAPSSRKISISGGQTNQRNFRSFEIRPAYHDSFDADQGALSFSEISVLQPRFRQEENDNGNIHLDKFDIIRIVSFNPVDVLQKKVSWMGSLNTSTAPDEMFYGTGFGKTRQAQAGVGYSTYLSQDQENYLAYSFLKLNFEHSDTRDEKFRYGSSFQVGVLARLTDSVRLGWSFEFFTYSEKSFDKATHFNLNELQAAWHFQSNWEARASWRRLYDRTSPSEHQFTLAHYF